MWTSFAGSLVDHIHITYSVMKTSEYMKDHMYLNCEERHEDMTDHPSYTHNLKLKPKKVISGLNEI